jgi:hypothetical protein
MKFDFDTCKGLALEAKALMAEVDFLCHVEDSEGLKDLFIRLGYVANDAKGLFNE